MAGSYLNFQPLLSTYQPGKAGAIRAEGIKTAGNIAAQSIERAGAEGRKREEEFKSLFDNTLDKSLNRDTQGYILNRYNQLKKDGLRDFMQKKDYLGRGRLTPEQTIDLKSKMNSLEMEAKTLNGVSEEAQRATKYAVEKGAAKGVKVNQEMLQEYKDALTPDEKGNYDQEKLASFLAKTKNTVEGSPFLSYDKIDIDTYLNQARPAIKKELEKKYKESIEKAKAGGYTITDTETSTYGDRDTRLAMAMGMISNSPKARAFEYNAGNMLTEDEKVQAEIQFRNSPNPYTAYYLSNSKLLDEGYGPDTRPVKVSERLDKKKGSGKGGYKSTIKPIDYEWSFTTNAVPIDGDFNISEDGVVDKKVISDGEITKITKNKDGELVMYVNTGEEDPAVTARKYKEKRRAERDAELEKEFAKSDEWTRTNFRGRVKKLTEKEIKEKKEEMKQEDYLTQEDIDFLESLESKKAKTGVVEIPITQSLYYDLSAGFEKKKMNVEGFDQIDVNSLPKGQPKTKEEQKKDYGFVVNDEVFETYSDSDRQGFQMVIDDIAKNPSSEKSKKWKAQLMELGIIKE